MTATTDAICAFCEKYQPLFGVACLLERHWDQLDRRDGGLDEWDAELLVLQAQFEDEIVSICEKAMEQQLNGRER